MIEIEKLRGHTLVLGTTGYGKTVVSKWICSKTRLRLFTAVLDLELEEWDCDLLSTDFDTFKKKIEHFIKVNKTREIFERVRKPVFYLFIEEAHEYTGTAAAQLKSWAKRIRKYGGKIFFIGQRCVDVAKGIRTECESYIVFNQSPADSLELKATTNSIEISETAPRLGDGEFFVRNARHADIGFFRYSFDKRLKAGVKIEKVTTIKSAKIGVLGDTV